MSYILEALRKAERDRRRSGVPTLETIHSTPAEGRRRWPWLAAGVVVLGAAGVGLMLVNRPPRPPAPAGVAARPAQTPPVSPAPAVDAPGPVAARPATPETGSRAPDEIARSTPPPRTAVATAPPRDPVVKRPAEPRAEGESRPREEPEKLKLEVLIYSETPSERVAYINGRRFVEGERIDARTTVERITRDGVVLASGASRYILQQK